MTVDELSVRISIAADEAIAALDGMTERMTKFTQALEVKHELKLDADKAKDDLSLVEAASKNIGEAIKSQSKEIIKELDKGKDSAFSLLDVMSKLGKGWKSILTTGAIGLAVELVTSGIAKLIEMSEEAKRAEEERMQASREAADEQQSRLARLRELLSRYGELSRQSGHTMDDNLEMLSIQSELAKAYGITASNVNGLAAAYDKLAEGSQKATKKELEELYDAKSATTWDARQKALKESKDAFQKYLSNLKEYKKWYEAYDDTPGSLDQYVKAQAQAELGSAKTALLEYEGLFSDWFSQALELMVIGVERDTGKINEPIAKALTDVLEQSFSLDGLADDGFDGIAAAIDQYLEFLNKALTDDKLEPLTGMYAEEQNSLIEKMFLGDATPEETAYKVQQCAAQMAEAWQPLFDQYNIGQEVGRSFIDALLPRGYIEEGDAALAELTGVFQSLAEASEVSSTAFAEFGDSASDVFSEFSENSKKTEALKNSIREMADQRTAISNLKKLKTQMDGCVKGSAEYREVTAKVDRALVEAGSSVEKAGKDYKNLDKAIADAESGMNASASAISGGLESVISWAQETIASLQIRGDINVNTSPAIAALNGLIQAAQFALSILSMLGLGGGSGGSESRKGGGGGGGKKADDGVRAAEEAARAAEQARQDAIRRDYDLIAHKRHMNEITLEQELSMIERIRSAHQLNAEEIMEWEEKIYDLKQEIRERDAQSVDTLADGVVSALEARYEAMRDAETDRLDTSRKAWEQWRDDSVAAIEDQIKALDKLSDTEDREAKDAEELRKIEKLRREIAYEQDEYNRMKLEQQLEKALDSREERLRKLALQDQKDALREEIERINDKADQQISALDKEQESMEAAYAERLKAAAINAEAERLLLTQSQDQLMALLNEYVPEYNALGQSMGEKLLDGFKSKVGDVVNWFKDFNAGIVAMQEQLATVSNAAADSLYQSYGGRQNGAGEAGTAAGVTVHQTVQFYEPVESPSQVARRIEDVNDALGGLLV